MKVWYHVIAALVGLALAALIVYLVFGSASQEGAVQDGDAGSLAAGSSQCGTVAVGDLASAAARRKATDNPPALFDADGPIASIPDSEPEQQQWVARVHAGAGLCLDEITIANTAPTGKPATNDVTLVLSTTDDVTATEAGAYAGSALTEAFSQPFSPRRVTLSATVGDSERTIVISSRAWNVFETRRRQVGRPATAANLKLFRQASGFGPSDLRISGW